MRAYAGMVQRLAQANGIEIKRTCEIGSGRGSVSQYLAADGAAVTLVDMAATGLDLALENWKRFGISPEPRRVLASCESTQLQETFDVVLSIGLLEHFAKPQATLKEALRLTRPGGLSWHVIINGESTESMYRSNWPPEIWRDISREAGQEATVRQTQIGNVLEMWCIKNGQPD